MFAVHEQYLFNEKGQKKMVFLSYAEWKKILHILEEYEDICIYDKAKSRKSDPISFKKVLKKIKNV